MPPPGEGTVWRAAQNECDVEEVCATDVNCPLDIFVADETSCGMNGESCVSGICQGPSYRALSLFGVAVMCMRRRKRHAGMKRM